MKHLEVSGAVRPIKGSLGVKGLRTLTAYSSANSAGRLGKKESRMAHQYPH